MELLRGDQTMRRSVRFACGAVALATLALAACNNDNTQTGPGGANTLVFVGNVNGANASLAGSLVLTVDETRAVATFKVVAPTSDHGTATGEDGTATIGDFGIATIGVKGKATGDAGTGTGDAGTGSDEAGTATNETGTASGGTTTTLQDATKAWTTDKWAGLPVRITAGTGAGEASTVTSNTATTLTVSPALATAPDATSKYLISLQTSTTLKDTTKTWHTNIWTGRPVTITAGKGAVEASTVSSNTTNTLTVSPAWTTIPDSASKYTITQTTTTLQDITKKWPRANLWAARLVLINAGTGAGQASTVTASDSTRLTVSPAWTTIPDGTSKYVIAQTSTTLQDTTKTWTSNEWLGRLVTITAGTGAGQSRSVSSNDINTLTVSAAWTTTPDGTSEFVIGQTSTTLQDVSKTWTTNQWAGRLVTITGGTGAGQARTVSSNDVNTLTVSPAWTTTPDGTSKYVITAPGTQLADNTKTWTANQWAGLPVVINAGAGAGQTRTVVSNTADTLTVSPAWDPIPTGSSEYVITQTPTTLQDITKTWTVDQWAGRPVTIKAGAGAGQTSTVSTNTANTLTVSPAWTTMLDATSEYRITQASTKLQDLTKTWTTDQWKTHTVTIKAGTGAGQAKTVSSNTANTLTVSAWSTKPDGSSQYVIGVGAATTIGLTGTYNSSSRTFSATDPTGAYTFSGAYDGSSRLEGTFTGPSSSSGTFLTERATSNPQAYCGPFTSTSAGENGIFNVTLSGTTLYGTATAATTGTVFALDGTTVAGDAGTGSGAAGTANSFMTGPGQTSTTLQDTTQTWTANQWAGRPVRINAGFGAGQSSTVVSNDVNTLTVSPAWTALPEDQSSGYVIQQTSTTLEDLDKAFTTNEWAGRTVTINAGSGAGQTRTVSSNNATILTVSPAWALALDGTSQYVISTGITVPILATGQANSTLSRFAGSFTFGANTGTWGVARCDQ